MIKCFVYSDKKNIILTKNNDILFYKPNRNLKQGIAVPCFNFDCNGKIKNIVYINSNYQLVRNFLQSKNKDYNNITTLPYIFDNKETDKACMYVSRRRVYFNKNFFQSLSYVGKKLVYYHELGHQVFNGNKPDNEINCDIYALLRCYCEGYSLYMIRMAFKQTLNDNSFNDSRLQRQFKILLRLQKNINNYEL